jgi:hypothetical protein
MVMAVRKMAIFSLSGYPERALGIEVSFTGNKTAEDPKEDPKRQGRYFF